MKEICLECLVKHIPPTAVEDFKELITDKELLTLLPHRLVRNQHVIRVTVSGTQADLLAWLAIADDLYPKLIPHHYCLNYEQITLHNGLR